MYRTTDKMISHQHSAVTNARHLRVVHDELVQQSLFSSQPEEKTTKGGLKFNSLTLEMFYAEYSAVHNIIKIIGKRSSLHGRKRKKTVTIDGNNM